MRHPPPSTPFSKKAARIERPSLIGGVDGRSYASSSTISAVGAFFFTLSMPFLQESLDL